MKKTLALVLALAMVFSTITVAFAEDTLGADAQTCSSLGMLKGETGTVDAAYVATAPTRLQAAIMFLRLKGLEAEALAFTGAENFADADQVNWAGGKAIMAFLKANPQYGWVGDAGKLNPNNKITAQEYYKVMLEALGYKQTTPEVVGDFAWADVFTFAASVGLTKVATVANFTVNDLAVATVEALKLNVKDGDKTLAATLVEAGKIDKAAAVAAGLYTEAATATAAKLDTVSSIGNAVVLVEFDADVEKAFAENVANYKLVEKGTSTAVEVKAAVLDATETTLAVLETAALTAGKAYTMTVGDVSKNFAGVAKKTAAPEIDKVEGTDTDRVVVTFTASMDMATALDPANYAIAGVTVNSVVWDDPDGTRDAVKLITTGLVANKTYKVTVTNVKNSDLVVLKSASKNFVSKTDKKAPVIDSDNTEVKTNTRILLAFKDDNEISKESAENLSNYKLTIGSTDNVLEITAAKLVEDDNDDLKWVELTTASQKGSQKYVLHVNNITDTSVLANKMAKEDKINVYGKKVDEKAPKLTNSGIEYVAADKILLTFTDAEKARLDFATAQDINNYSVNNDISVEKAEMMDADDADCMQVILTVSTLGDKSSYKISVENVADEYGNAMKSTTVTKTYSKDEATSVSAIKNVKVVSDTKIEVYFTKYLVSATAKDVANYSIDEEVGTPKKAAYDNELKKVTLTTPELKTNKVYKLTINGVTDIGGKVLTSATSKFVVSPDENDTEAPEILDVEVLNTKVIRVTYNEEMEANGALTINSYNANGTVGSVFGTANAKVTYEDDTVVEYLLGSAYNAAPYLADADYIITKSTTTDLAGNKTDVEDGVDFSGNDEDVEGAELYSWEQTNPKKFTLQFSENIDVACEANTALLGVSGFSIDVDADDETIVYLKYNKVIPDDFEKDFDLSAALSNYHGIPVQESDPDEDYTTLEGGLEDEDDPYIEEVVSTDRKNVEITFNEDLEYEGRYEIVYDKDEDGTIESSEKFSGTQLSYDLDDDVVTVTLNGTNKFESKYIYTLKVVGQARDFAGNKLDKDAEFDFVGSDVKEVQEYITGVKLLNGSRFKVYTSKKYNAATVTAGVYFKIDNVEYEYALADSSLSEEKLATSTKDGFTFNMSYEPVTTLAGTVDVPLFALLDGVTYTVKMPTIGSNVSYTVKGIVEDDISVADTSTANEYVVTCSDLQEGDVVAFANASGILVCDEVAPDGDSVTLSYTIATGELVNVIVVRDGVVLSYKVDFDLTQAE